MKKYFPFKSDRPGKNIILLQMIIKKFILVLLECSILLNIKMKTAKNLYINRHKKNESKFWNKSGIDTASWWGLKYLWSYPTKEDAYNHIKRDLKTWGII
jgi:hypothetical protein